MDEDLPKVDAALDQEFATGSIWGAVWARRKTAIVVLFILEAIFLTLGVFYLSSLSLNTTEGGIFIFLLLIPPSTIFGFYNMGAADARSSLFEKFASLNDYQFASMGQPADIDSAPARILPYRGSQLLVKSSSSFYPNRMDNLVSGNFLGRSFRMYMVGGINKHGSPIYSGTTLEIVMQQTNKIPHIILDSDLGVKYADMERVILEHNFDGYFATFADESLQPEVLRILNSDFMAFALDKLKSKKLEILDGKLYIYFPKIFSSTDDIVSGFAILKMAVNYLDRN
jgi:hypothetical protein